MRGREFLKEERKKGEGCSGYGQGLRGREGKVSVKRMLSRVPGEFSSSTRVTTSAREVSSQGPLVVLRLSVLTRSRDAR